MLDHLASEFALATDSAVGVIAGTLGIYAAVVLYTRLAGLRSFSKMSSFDFAITVAIGSVIASTLILDDVTLLQGAVALALIYALQVLVSISRRQWKICHSIFDNQPVLLMARGEILHENLRNTRVTEEDLRAKLREANVHSLERVLAVVFETTGDVSVLHGEPGTEIDPGVLRDVVDADRLRR